MTAIWLYALGLFDKDYTQPYGVIVLGSNEFKTPRAVLLESLLSLTDAVGPVARIQPDHRHRELPLPESTTAYAAAKAALSRLRQKPVQGGCAQGVRVVCVSRMDRDGGIRSTG